MPAYFISDDPALLDLDVTHGFLATCYWSPGIARERLERAVKHSLCLGMYHADRPRSVTPPPTAAPASPPSAATAALPSQVGFARVVTDRATYAYLCDVFILEAHRGRGLSKRLMRAVIVHPDLRGIRRLALFTRDAHGLYQQFGFAPSADPTRYMEIVDRESYRGP